MKYKLKTAEWRCLCEALRRYKCFHDGEQLATAWTGLGTKTSYLSALNAGLMKPVFGFNPRAPIWWKLTERGVEIVQSWLDAGYGEVEDNLLKCLPPKEVK